MILPDNICAMVVIGLTTELARTAGAEHELDLYVPRERRTWGGDVLRRGWSP